jgi:signal transduction histidine kinase
MSAGEYLRDRQYKLLLQLISMAAMSAFLYSTGTAPGVLIIIAVVWITGEAVCHAVGFYKTNARLKELHAVMNGLDKKYLFAECVSKPAGIYERKLFSFLKRAGKSMIEAVSDAESRSREYREYIEDWVHEIKAPITAAQLVCGNSAKAEDCHQRCKLESCSLPAHKSEQTRKLTVLLAQIEEHVERALYYARAGSVEKDFIVREASLSDIVRDAVVRHRTLLIQSGVRVEADFVNGAVYTDAKWVTFMLGQLLSNAIRYRKENPVVSFTTERRGDTVRLTVTDNGAGIPAVDLPRIFERGFTGDNGRMKEKSTGMGLYICKKLADFLQIKLEADSVQGEYTAITLTFPYRRRNE